MTINPAHIYWFAHYNMLGPCTRYRGKYLLEKIEEQYDISYDFIYPSYQFKKVLHFILLYFKVLFFRKKNSIIVFQKTYTIGFYSSMLKVLIHFRNHNTIYDIDDAYYVKFPPSTIHYFFKKCTICITGSQSLADYAKQISGNAAKILVLSSPIIHHNHLKTNINTRFTIGWAGFYNYHRQSLLKILFPAIQQIQKEINLVLLGVVKEEHFKEIKNYFNSNKNVNLILPDSIDWLDEDAFYQMVSTFDVGVSPLLDTEENRAKSAFKLKQYLCCGVPVIGSDTGENAKVIEEGRNGFVANDSDSFYEKLKYIMEMKDVKWKELSVEALQSVQQYKMEKYSQQFVDVVRRSFFYQKINDSTT